MNRARLTSGQTTWAAVIVGVVLISLLTSFGPAADRIVDRPELLLGLSTGAALLSVFGATVVIALADRRELAEIGLLGTALMAASLLPLVHGLVTPGVIYDDTAAFRASSFLTLPVAIALGAPLLVPNSSFGRWASRRWHDWTLLTLLVVFLLAAVLAVSPDAIDVPSSGHPVTIVLSVAMAVCFVVLSLRQLTYYEIGRRSSNLIASVSLLFIGATAFQPMVAVQYGLGFWWFHLTGGVGVLGVLVGLLVMKWRSASAQEVLAPLLAREPLVAFELGLSPIVHRFIADLDDKDEITRDHVIRTGELALRVGERFGLSGAEMRRLGLAAMLHDVGKLKTPDEILKKPAGLDASEYEVIKLHPVHGEEMLRAEPALAVAADIVRHHHERVDGGGYPDGLVGTEIPLASRIIACCDAWDAMTNDRPYRKAMSPAVATRIFREHAGTQWDPNVIDQVIATVMSSSSTGRLALVGREATTADDVDFDPDEIERLLAAVDAEI